MDKKKLELGVFVPIANNGWIISKNSPQYMPTFELNKKIALLAEEVNFDYLFSMVKWKGFGGETKHWDYSVESFTLMSALAAITSKIGIIASVQPLIFNPVATAKMFSTIDDISNGRFGMNLVTGQYFDEYAQMGILPENFASYRYEFAEEWLKIVKKLWTEERTSYQGKYFNIEDCVSNPKPIQKVPSIVCAGQSDTGLDFTVRNATHSFVSGTDFEHLKSTSKKAHSFAQKYGRTIKTNTVVNLIIADTDKEANEIKQHYLDGVDVEAVENITNIYSKDVDGATSKVIVEQFKKSVFYAFLPVVGSPETIATTLADIHLNGELNGLHFTFPDYLKGLKDFNEKIRPLLLDKGVNLSDESKTFHNQM